MIPYELKHVQFLKCWNSSLQQIFNLIVRMNCQQHMYVEHPFIYSSSLLGIQFYPWSQRMFLQSSQNCNYEQAITSSYCFRNNQQDIQPTSFETRVETSIIISVSTTNISSPPNKHKNMKKSPKITKTKITKPNIQKQSRNVISNIFRIFLKHLLQVHYYDREIDHIIKKRGLDITVKEFHQWVLSFEIDFKNYIKKQEIRKMIVSSNQRDMQGIIKTLFILYYKQIGTLHSLTSRRIESKARSMHLSGFREILLQFYF